MYCASSFVRPVVVTDLLRSLREYVASLTDLGWKPWAKSSDPSRNVFPKAKKVFPNENQNTVHFLVFRFYQSKQKCYEKKLDEIL